MFPYWWNYDASMQDQVQREMRDMNNDRPQHNAAAAVAASRDPAVVAAELASTILHLLQGMPEDEVKAVLALVMKNRCPRCFDYSADGSFWCCYDSRGD